MDGKLVRIRYFDCHVCGPELNAMYGTFRGRGPTVVAVVTSQVVPVRIKSKEKS